MHETITPPAEYAITQHIPVADHVYKYLLKRCGTDHIKASRVTFLGSLLLSLQSRNYDVTPADKKFTKVFSVTIPQHKYDKLGMHITPQIALLFNDQIDKMFRDEMFCHILINKNVDKKMFKKSMEIFLEVYQIDEDDLRMDTLYRDFKRKKTELAKNLNTTSSRGQF
jgi:hypothetical protein